MAGAIDLDCNGNGSLDLDELAVTALGTFRPISLFRADNLGSINQSVELLYGSPYWPSYVPNHSDCAPGKGRYAIFRRRWGFCLLISPLLNK